MNRGQQTTLIGAIGLIIGALLPWVSVTSLFGKITTAGYEGDGVFTGGIGALLLLGALLSRGRPGMRYSIATAVFALIAGLIAIYDLLNVSSIVADIGSGEGIIASTGPGLYVSILGAIIAFAGGLQVVPEQSEPVISSEPES